MWLALGTLAVVFLALVWELSRPRRTRLRASVAESWRARLRPAPPGYDPGRERRAEQRARELLRSCVDEEDFAMYRELGFLRVPGAPGAGGEERYAYLIYPHRPVIAYVPETGELLNEYCVAFPDETRPYGSARLPDSDDVLAKFLALRGDERRLIEQANMHLPGRQVDPERVRRDLGRLAAWDRARRATRVRAA